MFKMLDPSTLPRAMSPCPVTAASRLTTNSGELVPNATTVSPATRGVRPIRRASELLPITRDSAPAVSMTIDSNRKRASLHMVPQGNC